MSCESEVAVLKPASTYEWLCTLPMATSAGSTVSSLYQGSKNYSYVTQYALETVESSMKKAASGVSPVVRKLDRPIQVVDSYAASKLVALGDKVPALKCKPEEVVNYFTETKESLTCKIAEGRSAVSTRITDSKDAVVNSRAGVLVSDGKQAVVGKLSQGKEVVTNTITAGRDAVYTRVQSGADRISSSSAGKMVGAGVNHSLAFTEGWVDYLLPELENEEELTVPEVEMKEKEVMGLPRTRQPKHQEDPVPNNDPEDEPAHDDDPEKEVAVDTTKEVMCEEGKLERLHRISRKVKVRMYYRSVQRLQGMQQSCQETLTQLKDTVDLLKIAHVARDGLDHQYQTVTSALKNLESQLKHLLACQADSVKKVPCPDKEDEEDNSFEWLSPKPKGPMQCSLDYAKQLSEKVFHTFQSVTVATTYLPKQLKTGSDQAYQYAQEMYSTLKPVQAPMDLSFSALNRISSLLETQLGYITQLGSYLTSVLQRRSASEEPASSEEDEDEDDEPAESEVVAETEPDDED